MGPGGSIGGWYMRSKITVIFTLKDLHITRIIYDKIWISLCILALVLRVSGGRNGTREDYYSRYVNRGW